jgi:hypothetical protein
MSNYKSAVKRINKSVTKEQLEKASIGIDRVHAIGHLTDNELMRLDRKICDRLIIMENK